MTAGKRRGMVSKQSIASHQWTGQTGLPGQPGTSGLSGQQTIPSLPCYQITDAS